jgi:hypothetical protein
MDPFFFKCDLQVQFIAGFGNDIHLIILVDKLEFKNGPEKNL